VQSQKNFRIVPPENDISKLGRPERKDMDQPVRILGIPGSLRKGSYNGFLLRAAQQLAPVNVQIESFTIFQPSIRTRNRILRNACLR
jgi:hypothetical protein